MADFKGTPGPWGIIQAGNQWAVVPMDRKGKPRDGRSTVDIASGSTFNDGWEANSRLLAASPDLLAACERATHEINRADGTTGSALESLRVLRAAVAKAKGT